MLCRLPSSLCVLVCAAAIVTFARADTTGGTHNSTWLIERVADPIFDTLNVTAVLRETGVTSSSIGLQKALVLHCFERELDVVVVWGKSDVLGPSLSGDSPLEVVWRFDDTSPQTERWSRTKDKIERNWLRPPGTVAGLKCVVRVSQLPGGNVIQVDIKTGSGNVAFDRSVEEAVLRSSPLPVPKDPSLFDRHIVITFEPEA